MEAERIEHCRERLALEERLASGAPSEEAAMVHLQMAMLYRAQLDMMARRQESRKGSRY